MERIKHRIITIKELENTINKIFSTHDEILLTYLYGSYATRNNSEFSDIDIGILLNRDFKMPGSYQIDLILEIESKFEYKVEIDLQILNDGTPRFLYNIIKNGQIIYLKNETIQQEFEIKVLYEYMDIKPMLNYYDEMTILEVLKDKSKS